MADTITLSKVDCARRQLETSIKLFFMNQDIVSIHTLVCASHQILHDLAKKKGDDIKSFLLDKSLEYIKPEFHEEFIHTIRKAGNYFKHADNDSDTLLEFPIHSSEGLIFDAVNLYGQLTNEYTSTMASFNSWFYLNHPHLINSENIQFKSIVDNIINNPDIDVANKEFFIGYIAQIEDYKNDKFKKDLKNSTR